MILKIILLLFAMEIYRNETTQDEQSQIQEAVFKNGIQVPRDQFPGYPHAGWNQAVKCLATIPVMPGDQQQLTLPGNGHWYLIQNKDYQHILLLYPAGTALGADSTARGNGLSGSCMKNSHMNSHHSSP